MDSQIEFNKTSPIVCEVCGGEFFRPVYILRKVSRLLLGTPEDVTMNINLFACDKCGHINKDFLPKQEEKESPIIQDLQ